MLIVSITINTLVPTKISSSSISFVSSGRQDSVKHCRNQLWSSDMRWCARRTRIGAWSPIIYWKGRALMWPHMELGNTWSFLVLLLGNPMSTTSALPISRCSMTFAGKTSNCKPNLHLCFSYRLLLLISLVKKLCIPNLLPLNNPNPV